jgi:hypothetical protein
MKKCTRVNPPCGRIHVNDEGLPLGEDGNILDPPLLLIAEIAAKNLLGVKQRRIQKMVEQGLLPAHKATTEQQAILIRTGRLTSQQITFKGVYLVPPSSLTYALTHRPKVGHSASKKHSEPRNMTG